MSVLTSAVVLAWICLTVLALGMAGMLRQIRELQADVAQLSATALPAPARSVLAGRRVPELAGTGPLVLLVLDPGCGFCDAVAEPFSRLAATHPAVRFEVLAPTARWAGLRGVRSRVDQQLLARLDLPWAPCLVLADSAGTLQTARPVSAPDRLGEQVTALLSGLRSDRAGVA